jgi:hypothetical protein
MKSGKLPGDLLTALISLRQVQNCMKHVQKAYSSEVGGVLTKGTDSGELLSTSVRTCLLVQSSAMLCSCCFAYMWSPEYWNGPQERRSGNHLWSHHRACLEQITLTAEQT